MIIKSHFKPHPLLRSPHLQTLYGQYFRRNPSPKYRQLTLDCPDGDQLVAYTFTHQATPASLGDIVLFHGLGGCVESNYIRACVPMLQQFGFTVHMMLFRGCGGHVNKFANCYHAGHTDDIALFLNHLRSERPRPKALLAVGFSLGANALLKYLGEAQEKAAVDAAIAVSSPLFLEEGAKRLDQGFSKIYQHYLVDMLKKATLDKISKGYSMPITAEALNEIKTLRAFDDLVTAPLHDFQGADDYYDKNSSRQYLKHIKKNTHILHAIDDPFFTPKVIPTEAELSDLVTLELSQTGGHVGFIGGQTIPYSWLEKRVSEVALSQYNSLGSL